VKTVMTLTWDSQKSYIEGLSNTIAKGKWRKGQTRTSWLYTEFVVCLVMVLKPFLISGE
jgi:hypothetical protein